MPSVLEQAAGLAYAVNAGTLTPNNRLERVASAEGLMLRASIGLNYRTSVGSAIHPEMSLLKSLTAEDGDLLWYTFGIGWSFGALPEYGMARDPGEAWQ